MLVLLVALLLPPTAHAGSAQLSAPIHKAAWSVRWQPAKLVNGSPVVFQARSPIPLQSLSGKWLEKEVFFQFDPRTHIWSGIAGVSLETRPGTYVLSLEGTSPAGEKIGFEKKIAVGRAGYPSISVKVAKQYTEPSPQQLEQIKQDQKIKADLLNRIEREREWSGRFLPAVHATVSDVFGTRRVFNGQVQSMHQGLDYAVRAGTPISALNRGTVLLARPLYFEGNCVVLDHGQGLLTLYLHLSKIQVKEGKQVNGGERIGLSGGTGRATGPHLHLAVRWQGIYLDPARLFKLQVP